MSRRAGDRAAPGAPRAIRETRCACGSLLARLTAEGVELKCRRCKRLVVVRWGEQRALDPHARDPP